MTASTATRAASDFFIHARDGARLSARLWLPDGDGPWPALLEYIPYRKNDFTALRDSLRHPWFAAHGYACVRVDLRGSGDSDGLLLDEYLPLELDDACDVIAWIAEQPWCTGAVGMFGKSWGGFNALQVAARRPPALRAILTIYSTDDRFADDVHYRGGAVLASEALSWATTMLAYNARPPDPLRRDDWRAVWLNRLEHTPPFADAWFAHQRRDSFWRHGSVCEDFSAINVPVFAVGGWADGYTDPVFRLLAGLTSPRLGLVGPWVHEYPEVAVPRLSESAWASGAARPEGAAGAPTQIGFLQESLRWWDHWLKGRDTGIMREPMLRVFLQDSAPPSSEYDVRAGRWSSTASWPPISIDSEQHVLHGPGAQALPVPADLSHGAHAGMWCAYGLPDDPPGEQGDEDARCLVFDLPPVDRVTTYLGRPTIDVALTSDRPIAHLVVRLCDVASDGTSTLVSNGVLNLTHRAGSGDPIALPIDEAFDARLTLDSLGYRLLPGHHWRVALNQIWWPRMWPQPALARLNLLQASLSLPKHVEASDVVSFDVAETMPLMAHTRVRPSTRRRTTSTSEAGRRVLIDEQDDGRVRLDDPGGFDEAGRGLNGLVFDARSRDSYSIDPRDPASAVVECRRTLSLSRGQWGVDIQAVSRMSMTPDGQAFRLEHTLTATEGASIVFERTWNSVLPLDHPDQDRRPNKKRASSDLG